MRVGSVQSVNGVLNQNGYGLKKVFSPAGVVQPNFTARFAHMNQIASFTPENNGLGLAEAKLGGEGVVGFEAIESLRKKEHYDARSFMPIWNYNNPQGGHKFLVHQHKRYPDWGKDGVTPKTMNAGAFYSGLPGQTKEEFAKFRGLDPSEVDYVVQSAPVGGESRYCIIEPTSAKGNIQRLSTKELGEIDTIPYQLFKISSKNPEYNKLKGQPHYFIFTPDLAKAAKPYSYDCWGNVPFDAEIINADGIRAMANVVHKDMNTEEFGFYRPASVWSHDRPGHMYANVLANMSSNGIEDVNGIKVHITAHNTGRNYQGMTNDPFKFLAVVGDASDANRLKNSPHFDLLKRAMQVGIESNQLSDHDREIVRAVLAPAIDHFKDGAGTYNVVKGAIIGVRTNPKNVSTGTVSLTFDKEMKSQDTPDAAKYLTDDYASIPTKSYVNGCTPANLELNNPDALFGEGKTGLNAQKAGFNLFEYNGENIEEIVNKRHQNAKWLTNLLWAGEQRGQDELNKVFFNETQIAKGQKLMGSLAPIADDGIMVFSWGRPDEQKGFPILLKGFKKFLENPNIPQDQKLRFRVLTGAGKWSEDASDYKMIESTLKEIAELEGGVYKSTAMHADGWTSRRLVGCATYGGFTSRREMCGITPLECKAAGVPYFATKTGGPVDYTNSSNGFLTKEAVEGPPERYGLTWSHSAQELDAARVERQADQVAEIFEEMLKEQTGDKSAYIAKCKKNIDELIDWHNNAEYNKGVSATKGYIDGVFEIDKGWEARDKNPLKRLMGAFGEVHETAEKTFGIKAKNKPTRIALLVVTGALLIAGGGYWLFKSTRSNKEQKLDKAA